MMAGMPGTGKSTVALGLGAALHWPVVDKDTLKSTLLNAGIAEGVAAGAAYDLLLALGRDILVQQKQSVILDSPTTWPITLERAEGLALAAGADLKVVL